MDRMDSGAICGSSPFTSLAVSRLDHSCIDVSGELLFSEPSPSPVLDRHHRSRTSFFAFTPTNTSVQMTTPITSPANTSRCKVGIRVTIQKPLVVRFFDSHILTTCVTIFKGCQYRNLHFLLARYQYRIAPILMAQYFVNFVLRHLIVKTFPTKIRAVCSGCGFIRHHHEIVFTEINKIVIFIVFKKCLTMKIWGYAVFAIIFKANFSGLNYQQEYFTMNERVLM